MVTRRTFVLPGRLIVVLLVVILPPLVITTAVPHPEQTPPISDQAATVPPARRLPSRRAEHEGSGSSPTVLQTGTSLAMNPCGQRSALTQAVDAAIAH